MPLRDFPERITLCPLDRIGKVCETPGFRREARLTGHGVDLQRRKHNPLVLSADIPALMQKRADTCVRAAGSLGC